MENFTLRGRGGDTPMFTRAVGREKRLGHTVAKTTRSKTTRTHTVVFRDTGHHDERETG
jgi:hypothetical protein